MGKTTKERAVSLRVARAVLASTLVGDSNLGIDGGDWANTLIRLITRSDKENRELLATIYPEWVLAVTAVTGEHWGIEWLQTIAREGVA